MATRAEQEALYQQWLATNPQLQSEEYGPTGDNESYQPGGTRYYFDYNGKKLYWDGRGFSFAPTNDYTNGGTESQYSTGVGTYDKDSGFGALDWKKADRPEDGGWISNNQELFAGIALAAMGGAALLTGAESSALASNGLEVATGAGPADVGVASSGMDLAGSTATVGAPIASPSVTATPLAETVAGGATASTPTLAQTAAGATIAGEAADYGNEGRNYPTPESTQGTGGSPVNASTESSWDLPSIIRGVTNGTLTGDNLARILTSMYGANRQNQYANDLLNMYKPYNEQATWYGNKLRETYDNPSSYFQSPEWQGIQNTTSDLLQRRDAAGGNLSNNFARQARLQDLAATNISNYRTGLSDVYRSMASIGTGQGMQNAFAARANAGGGLVGTIGDIMSQTDKKGLGGRYYG